jgi:hypothetical protein
MRRRGIALILLWAALLMIGALVLSFLSAVPNDENNNATPVGRITWFPGWVLMNEVPAYSTLLAQTNTRPDKSVIVPPPFAPCTVRLFRAFSVMSKKIKFLIIL